MYKLFNDAKTNELCSVLNKQTNTSIPINPANTDYQQYLKWLAEGNTPTPADEVTQ
jgi:hypothetical protein